MRRTLIAILAALGAMQAAAPALKKTGGSADGDKFLAAAKGMAWTSPRGPVKIEPETRDITQNIYIRKVETVDGKLYNVEFSTLEAVKDPTK